MASIETLLEQVSKSDLDITALLKLRSTVEDRISSARRSIQKQLEALDGAMSSASASASAASPAPARRGRPVGSVNRKRRVGRPSAGSAGKHAGMTVAEAVRKVLSKGGGKMSTSQIKKAFDDAGDTRVLNFTILVSGGVLKKVGTESKKDGKKGRAGGIYALV
jgi:hypothetical protein